MNSRVRVAVVAGHLAGWSLVVAFVVLLTLIFNFLGTIICAALAGMMMGSARLARLHCLLASLIFPAVIATVLRLWRAELSDKQVLVLSALCFGVFWLVWGMMSVLCATPPPSRAAARSREPASAPAVERSAQSAESTTPSKAVAAGTALAQSDAGELGLESWCGTWVPRPNCADPGPEHKLLEIKGEKAVLRVLDAQGQVSASAQAVIQMGRVRPPADTGRGQAALLLEFTI